MRFKPAFCFLQELRYFLLYRVCCVKTSCPAHGSQPCLQPRRGCDGKRRCTTALGLAPGFPTTVLVGKAEMGRFVLVGEGKARWAALGPVPVGREEPRCVGTVTSAGSRGNGLLLGGKTAPLGRAGPRSSRGGSAGPGGWGQRIGLTGTGTGVPRSLPALSRHCPHAGL